MTYAKLLWCAAAATLSLPAFAQTEPDAAATAPQAAPAEASPLDDLAPADTGAEVAAPAPTGDPVLDRLNALEAEVRNLKARNSALEDKLASTETRVESAEVRAARAAEWAGPAPTVRDVIGNFTFKPRGTLEVEGAAYFEDRGDYVYNDGTSLRRARFGFEGTFFRDFNFRLETEFGGNTAVLYDAYIAFTGVKPWTFTVGQHKAFTSLDTMTSQTSLLFMERSMFSNAFGGPIASRRIGVSAAYTGTKITAALGFFGENEGTARAANAGNEGYGVHSRVTWEPVNDVGRLVHVGASGFLRTDQRDGAVGRAFRVSDRPGTRVDNGLIVDSGTVSGVDDVYYWGVEAAGIYGPLLVQAEYGRLYLERSGPTAAFRDIDYDGYYILGAWTITGETPSFRNGTLDRLRPARPFDPVAGTWGAFQLAFRYDNLDLSEAPGTRAGNRADNYAAALNWWLNPNLRAVFSYIHFEGRNTPLDPVGRQATGDVLQTRLHLDF